MTDLAPLPPGPFGLIYVDPPWAFRTHGGETRTPTQKAGEDHYPTMTLAQMAALPVADVAAKDALLAMWIIGSHCDEALALARAWGFSFVTDLFYWLKQKRLRPDQFDLFTGDIAEPKISMGYHTRKQVEPVWLFKRGKGLPVLAHDVRQLIIEPATTHSRKPEEVALRLERLYGTSHASLELFSRTTRPGWAAWGNEVGKFAAAFA